jgi:hypothetical protein
MSFGCLIACERLITECVFVCASFLKDVSSVRFGPAIDWTPEKIRKAIMGANALTHISYTADVYGGEPFMKVRDPRSRMHRVVLRVYLYLRFSWKVTDLTDIMRRHGPTLTVFRWPCGFSPALREIVFSLHSAPNLVALGTLYEYLSHRCWLDC